VGQRTVAKPLISTFHSFCVRLLRHDIETLQVGGKGYRKGFVIYDEADQQSVVKAAMRRLGIDDKQLTPVSVMGRISWAKNHMLDPQELYLQSADPKTECVAHIFEVYKQELAKSNALDFDDLLLYAVRVLKVSGETRERYNRRYRYILVDEYQDTNRPQYELMRMLAGEEHNVCAVGDEDQSIYSWRGADIRNILEFEQDFPEARIIRLEQNYRSTENILEAASSVVSRNLKRKGKNLWTDRRGGAKVAYYEAPDGENEALFAADYIAKYLSQAQAGDDGQVPRAAVLYRTNSQSRLLEEAMRRYQLKYHVVGGFSFYERAEVKDMISYLKAIQNPDDSIAIQRIINTPARGIGKTTTETLERMALETGLSLWGAIQEAIQRDVLQPRALAALKAFQQLMDDARAAYLGTFQARMEGTASTASPADRNDEDDLLSAIDFSPEMFDEVGATEFDPQSLSEQNQAGGTSNGYKPGNGEAVAGFRKPGDGATTAELLKFLIDRTGYIEQLQKEDTPDALARIENLHELVNAAMDSRDRGETLNEFLDHAALVSEADGYDENSRITLMTLHAAKGLEFPVVFLVGLEEGLFPHSRTLMVPEDIEEERRLCYVGMTRAMDTLILTNARYRRRYGTDMPEASIPSRFLKEIPQDLLQGLGTSRSYSTRTSEDYSSSSHYAYEDEDQRPQYRQAPPGSPRAYRGTTYSSVGNIAEFFASRGKKFTLPKAENVEPTGRTGFRPGQKVRHPKYGEGLVYKREGEG
ncbi:MAG TPA: 3'-5' exonuclease, partial [Terriglobales bacterium]